MSVEIPSALIRRFQATLRKNAGVSSSYDPADPTLPSLSSLHDAALVSLDADPSLSYLRCTRCRRAAGLVRGPNSTLCILCGRDRSGDGPAQSLSFNSTFACKKLLESLQLDGSEVIDLDTESKDSNKGLDTQDNGLVLSSVLDLELKWPPEKEAAVNRSSDKAPKSSQAANLSGVDLATFSDSRTKIFSAAPSVITEELMPSKQTISTKSHVSSGSDNFASFKDLQTPNVALSSESSKGGGDFADSFADWEAGFQSASSQAMQLASESIDHYHGSTSAGLASLATDVAVSAESKSVDLFEGSTTEVSSHASSAPTFSEHTNADHEINNEGNSGESTNEWGQYTNPPDQLKNTSKTDDSKLKDDVQCTTSIGESWGQDEMWATSSMKAYDDDDDAFDDALDEDAFDDALDIWQDFASSKEAPGVSSNTWIQSANEIAPNEHASVLNLQDIEFGNFLQTQSYSSSGALGEQGADKVNGILLNTSASTGNIDEFFNVKNINGNSLEAWQDITSSNGASGDLSNLWTHSTTLSTLNEHVSGAKSVNSQEMEFGSFLDSDSVSGVLGDQKDPSEMSAINLDASVHDNNTNKFDKTKQSDNNDDSLNDWQEFTSSKEALGGLPNSWTSGTEAMSMEHDAGVKLVDPRVQEFGSFLYSNFFSGVDAQKGSSHANDIQLDALFSSSSTGFKSGGQKDPSDASAIKLDAPVSSNIVNEFDNTKQSDDNYDSLDDWQDFTSSNEASGVSPNSWASGSEATSMEHAPGTKQVDPRDSEFGSFVFSDSFSRVDGQRGSTHTNDIQLDALVSNSSTEFKSGGQKEPNEAITIKIDAPVPSNGRNEFDKTKLSDDNDDSLDFWQDFTSSKEASGFLSNSRTSGVEALSIKHAPGMKPVDPKDSEFGSFLYPGSFSGVDGQKVSTRANDIQLGALFSNSSTGFNKCGQKDPSEASAIKLVAPVYSNSVNEFDKTKQNEDNDDSLDDWQDFISSKEASGVLPNSWASGAEPTSMEHALGSNQVDPQDSEFGSFVFSDSFPGVDGQRCSTHVNDIQLETLALNSGTGFRNDKNMTDNGGLFGSWKDFTSSNEVPEGLSNLSKQTGIKTTSHEHTAGMKSVDLEDMEFGDFLQSDMFSGMSHHGDFTKANDVQLDIVVSTSSTKEVNNTRDINDNFDPFKAWQEFTSSSDAQGSLANLSTQPDIRAVSYEHASGKKLSDLRDMGFGSFLHSDSLLGAFGDVKSSSAVNGMQDTSVSYRMNGTDEKVAAASSIPGAVDAHESNISASKLGRTYSKVDMLLAQMSDLSFMLDDNLSIPKKVDSSNLKS